MIQLLNMGKPIVIISKHQASQLSDDVYIQINGLSGEVRQTTHAELFQYETVTIPSRGQSFTTTDGVVINLLASVSKSTAASDALTYGASAIGLVRSEFLQPGSLKPGTGCLWPLWKPGSPAAREPVLVRLFMLGIPVC